MKSKKFSQNFIFKLTKITTTKNNTTQAINTESFSYLLPVFINFFSTT